MPQQQLSWMYWGGNVMAVLMIAWVEQGECFQRVSRYLMPFAIHVQTSGNLSDSNTIFCTCLVDVQKPQKSISALCEDI